MRIQYPKPTSVGINHLNLENMTSKIIRIEGAFEIWGFFFEGTLVRTNRLRVRGWR